MDWTVRGSDPRGGRDFPHPIQTGPGAHPAFYTRGTGAFPEVKRPGRGADRPPPSKRRGHERAELYLYSPSGPQWPVIGRTLPLPLPLFICLFIRSEKFRTFAVRVLQCTESEVPYIKHFRQSGVKDGYE